MLWNPPIVILLNKNYDMIIKERLADMVLDVPFLKWLACGQVVRIVILMCRRTLKIVIMRSFYFIPVRTQQSSLKWQLIAGGEYKKASGVSICLCPSEALVVLTLKLIKITDEFTPDVPNVSSQTIIFQRHNHFLTPFYYICCRIG